MEKRVKKKMRMHMARRIMMRRVDTFGDRRELSGTGITERTKKLTREEILFIPPSSIQSLLEILRCMLPLRTERPV